MMNRARTAARPQQSCRAPELKETAFFFPHLLADANGVVKNRIYHARSAYRVEVHGIRP